MIILKISSKFKKSYMFVIFGESNFTFLQEREITSFCLFTVVNAAKKKVFFCYNSLYVVRYNAHRKETDMKWII